MLQSTVNYHELGFMGNVTILTPAVTFTCVTYNVYDWTIPSTIVNRG